MKRLKSITLCGMGSDRFIEVLKNKGIPLYHISFSEPRRVNFSVPDKAAESVKEDAQAFGFSCDISPASPTFAILPRITKNHFIRLFTLLMLLLIAFSTRFIWKIDIDGAGIYKGEILTYLSEAQIFPGTLKHSIDLKDLCNHILYRLPDIAWVRADIRGFALHVSVTQGISAPEDVPFGSVGHIVAACDGVIESIHVYSGTPAVKVGDRVAKGDILIYGYERGSAETRVPVQAHGAVKARIWRSAQAMIPAFETTSQRSGKYSNSEAITTPFFNVNYRFAENYLTEEKEIRLRPLIDVWFPIGQELATHFELLLEKRPRDIDALQRESAILAMQNLLNNCSKNDEIIDKWLNYSMIEGETILAVATAELLTDIGLFLNQAPN